MRHVVLLIGDRQVYLEIMTRPHHYHHDSVRYQIYEASSPKIRSYREIDGSEEATSGYADSRNYEFSMYRRRISIKKKVVVSSSHNTRHDIGHYFT